MPSPIRLRATVGTAVGKTGRRLWYSPRSGRDAMFAAQRHVFNIFRSVPTPSRPLIHLVNLVILGVRR